jgi:two-component system, cell cycle sensor histidine kinase and response regulator CckA
MAGAVAHLFNNQLGSVLGSLELAAADSSRSMDITIYLKNAMKATRQAAEVSGRILTYLGQTFEQVVSLDLSAIIRQGLPLLQDTILKDVNLITDLPSPGPTIQSNAGQIQLILSNLILNALEATVGGYSDICMKVSTINSTGITQGRCFPPGWQPREKAYACLEVADMGCGIAEKDIEKVFDPFFSTKFVGRGMGLSMVLGLMQTHGGAVTVESKPSQRTVFKLFFPLSTERPTPLDDIVMK